MQRDKTDKTTVKHAIILAAGLGTRLRPLTKRQPKPLVEVHGVPILHNALRRLARAGVRQATIVVGYRKESIVRSCGTSFAGVEIDYCESSAFDRTGSAYSLWLARHALVQDTLLLEGDVFFEQDVLRRLLSDAKPDIAAVAPFDSMMTGSAVTLSPSGHVKTIHMNQTVEDAARRELFKTINIFKLSAATLRGTLVPALEASISAGKTSAYVEQVLKHMVDERGLRLTAANCADLKWFEIDSEDDLRTAETIFRSQAPAQLEARATL